MKSRLLLAVVLILCGCLMPLTVAAQESATAPAVVAASNAVPNVVPNLVNYTGVLKDASGRALTGITGVTFLLYSSEHGGAPLWLETQNVTPDKAGHYTAQLGAASKNGIPSDLFVNGEGRWLGVQIGSEAEQPRVLLVAVPYAMKAVDAQTLGGLPASAFVLAAPPTSAAAASASPAAAATSSSSASTLPPPASTVTTTGGTASTISMFTTATNIQNSILTQTGTTAINVLGKLNHPATGAATALKGFNSQPDSFVASVFNSGTATPVAQTFQLQAEPANNDKTTATGTLNLLYATGTAVPAETGLKIDHLGHIIFAAGQANIPGAGTVTKVLTGPGLTGGPITTTGTIGIAAGGVSNADLAHSSLSVLAGADLTGGGLVPLGGSTTLKLDTTKVPLLAANNTFTGAQTINNSLTVSGSIASGGTVSAAGDVDASGNSFIGGFVSAGGEVFGTVGSFSSDVDAGGNVNASGSVNAGSQSTFGSSTASPQILVVENNGSSQALQVQNFANPPAVGSFTEAQFDVNGKATFFTDGVGNTTATGTKSAAVALATGAMVKVFSTESPEVWFEDYGFGQLTKGTGKVAIDSAFAQTASMTGYHVFVTPKGDCKGLYVTNETSSTFEVRELGGGQSDIAFDYRIVAHRKGYETVRLPAAAMPRQHATRSLASAKVPVRPARVAAPLFRAPATVQEQVQKH